MKISSLIHTLPRFSRRKAWFAGSAVVALSVAGVAIAASTPGPTSAVSATFTATTVANKTVQSCTGTDGTYEYTRATYSGTTAGATDPHLNGAITLDVSSVYNTTKNLGWLKAKVRVVSTTPGNDTSANLTGVNVNGTVQGFMVSGGNEHGNSVNLLANVTGSFTGAGGFTAGSIGTGAATNTALISTGSCNDSHRRRWRRRRLRQARLRRACSRARSVPARARSVAQHGLKLGQQQGPQAPLSALSNRAGSSGASFAAPRFLFGDQTLNWPSR